MDRTSVEAINRIQREEESRLFLEENNVYSYLFGEGHYHQVTDVDLQNEGEDVRYYINLFDFISIDEKERLGYKTYFALKTSGIADNFPCLKAGGSLLNRSLNPSCDI